MRESSNRILIVTACCAVWLVGFDGATHPGLQSSSKSGTPTDDITASVSPAGTASKVEASVAEVSATDEENNLNLGKQQFQAANFTLAEQYFRRAVTDHPRNAEAWLGLAAAYDRLNRPELADRAYVEAVTIAGSNLEILNQQSLGYVQHDSRATDRNTFVTQANFAQKELE